MLVLRPRSAVTDQLLPDTTLLRSRRSRPPCSFGLSVACTPNALVREAAAQSPRIFHPARGVARRRGPQAVAGPGGRRGRKRDQRLDSPQFLPALRLGGEDRKSTRLNSSH